MSPDVSNCELGLGHILGHAAAAGIWTLDYQPCSSELLVLLRLLLQLLLQPRENAVRQPTMPLGLALPPLSPPQINPFTSMYTGCSLRFQPKLQDVQAGRQIHDLLAAMRHRHRLSVAGAERQRAQESMGSAALHLPFAIKALAPFAPCQVPWNSGWEQS